MSQEGLPLPTHIGLWMLVKACVMGGSEVIVMENSSAKHRIIFLK